MTQPVSTILVVLIFGGSLIAFVWAVFRLVPAVGRLMVRAFWCPFRNQDVTAVFEEEPWHGRRVGVARCSAFSPSDDITCDKRCVQLRELPASPPEAVLTNGNP